MGVTVICRTLRQAQRWHSDCLAENATEAMTTMLNKQEVQNTGDQPDSTVTVAEITVGADGLETPSVCISVTTFSTFFRFKNSFLRF